MKKIFLKLLMIFFLMGYDSCDNEPVEFFPIAQEEEEEPTVDPVPDPKMPEEQEDVLGTWSLMLN